MVALILTASFPVVCCLLVLLAAAPETEGFHGNEYGSGVAERPQSEIDALVEVHNQGRGEVEPSAANMNRVTWSHELYVAAKEKVETCEYVVDIPDETGHYGKIVQFTGISRAPNFDLVQAVDQWFYLGKDSYNYVDDTCSRDNIFCRMYKLFTWAPMKTIGCHYHLCDLLLDTYTDQELVNTYYWKCNYFPVGNLEDASYIVGTPCLDCADGVGWCNNEYDLCDDQCSSTDDSCECLYEEMCDGVYTYDADACTCTCTQASCEDDPIVCLLNCGNVEWIVADNSNGICYCDCPNGYLANQAQDVCNDIDECLDPSLCDHHCENTLGSYYCTCLTGFELAFDEHTCLPFFQIGRHDADIIQSSTTPITLPTIPPTTPKPTTSAVVTEVEPTEAVATTACPELNCGDFGDYNPDSCECDCDPGYEFSELTCNDIDECQTMETGCDNCENLPGSYHCLTCPNGSVLNNRTELCEIDVCNLGSGMFCNFCGFLDTDECECVCFSGYEGSTCKDTCDPTDAECWPTYQPEPPMYAGQCVVFCPQFDCEGYLPCDKNGTLARAASYQHVRDGVCRCYCPLPWSGELCDECNLECANGGVLDAEECICDCQDGWFGVDCTSACVETSRLCTSRTMSMCGEVDIIDQHCPIMCSLCRPMGG